MARPGGNDLSLLLKGLGRLGSAAVEVHGKEINKAWANSSLRPLAEKSVSQIQDTITNPSLQPNISKGFTETVSRLYVVQESILAYITRAQNPQASGIDIGDLDKESTLSEMSIGELLKKEGEDSSSETRVVSGIAFNENSGAVLDDLDSLASLPGSTIVRDVSQVARDSEHEIKKRIKNFDPLIENSAGITGTITNEQLDAIDEKLKELQGSEFNQDMKVFSEADPNVNKAEPETVVLSKETLEGDSSQVKVENFSKESLPNDSHTYDTPKEPKLIGRKPLARNKAKSTLSNDAQPRKVPQSRLGRLVSFGGLAAGLGVGTLAEMTRRTLGVKGSSESGALLDASPFLTEANARRIVDTLCKVRGAALKLGQMLSIQDNAMLNPEVQKIFERVRQSADFMPTWQLERTLIKDFGPEWRSRVASFDDKPFAAASIGQVHQAVLYDGRSVAMKIQYPGVAEGIESDINNLIGTLSVAKILPEGLFIDSVIEVAKRELAWECDYVREKECTKRFQNLIKPYPEFYVPDIIDELCTKQVFTSELIEGIPVDQCVSLDQETRNYISSLILRLCLMEIFEFGFMQTDPNWSNFFYNKETQQLALLDFGACREYDKDFVDKYINIIHGAAVKDRDKVYEYSKQLGFLTGYEAKVMVDAHIDAVMILGEAFQYDRPFSFGSQDTTRRIQHLVPVMLSHRMCAPPEESYSLHRKMSGVFLLCAKLNAVLNCKPFFDDLWSRYEVGGSWQSYHEHNG